VLVRIQSRAQALPDKVGRGFLFGGVANLFVKADKQKAPAIPRSGGAKGLGKTNFNGSAIANPVTTKKII
jgi:hypothetical protein